MVSVPSASAAGHSFDAAENVIFSGVSGKERDRQLDMSQKGRAVSGRRIAADAVRLTEDQKPVSREAS